MGDGEISMKEERFYGKIFKGVIGGIENASD
jgi:hypothetical protein